MRIAALHLIRYGVFDSASIAFEHTPGQPDLHLVVGPNEAGKSTLRRAMIDALFPDRSSFNHWRPGTISLGATVEADGNAFSFERSTGALKPPEAKDALLRALGGRRRDAYAASQAFTHDDMRAAAIALADSRGDLHQLLVDTAAGLKGVQPVLKALSDESDATFKRDGRNKTASLRVLLNRQSEVRKQRDEALLSAPKYEALREANLAAEIIASEQRAVLQGARDKLAALQREIRAERPVAELVRLEAELAALTEVRLPQNARQRFDELNAKISAQRVAIDGAATRLSAIADDLTAMPLDSAALEARDAVERLRQAHAENQTRLARIPDLSARATREHAAASAARQSAAAGFPSTAAPPGDLDRRDILRLSKRGEALHEAVAAAAAAMEALSAPEPPAAAPPDPRMSEALAALEADGDVTRRSRDAEAMLAAAQDQLAVAEAAFAGQPICTTPVPLAEALQHERAIADALQRLSALADTKQAARDAANRAAAVRDATPQHAALDDAALQMARAERDALWQALNEGWQAGTAADFRQALEAADAIADARFAAAKELSALSERRVIAAEAMADATAAAAAHQAGEAEVRQARSAWKERLSAAGFTDTPADYRAWSDAYAELTGAKRAEASAAEAAKSYRDAIAGHCRAFSAVVEVEGEDATALQRAVSDARAISNKAAAAIAKAEAQRDAWRETQRERPKREDALAQALDALSSWREGFTARCVGVGIVASEDHERMVDLIETLRVIEVAERAEADHFAESAAIERQSEAFTADLHAVAEALGEDTSILPDAMVSRLVERLRHADARATQRREKEKALAGLEAERAAAEASLRTLTEALQADLMAAELDPQIGITEALRLADASDTRRALLSQMEAHRAALAADGLVYPECRAAVEALTSEARSAARDAAERAVSDAEADAAEAQQARGRAHTELTRAEAEARVGAAAQDTQTLANLAEQIADEAERAINLRLEIAILAAARDALTQRTQSPILTKASAIFSDLTGGRYTGLEHDTSVAQPTILANRASDGENVAIPDLSDGTRDQVVMSFRLAAAFEENLPFVVDDLFINFDNDRAERGFRALAQLAAQRQVIILTHHTHLLAVAERALGRELNQIRLSDVSLIGQSSGAD